MPVWQPAGDSALQVIAVLSFPESAELGLVSSTLSDRWPSLTPDCPAAHWFEREIAEQWELTPEGHPWLKPIRFEPPRRHPGGCPKSTLVGLTDFFAMTGEESHEVAVGPVHAGVIEPGHFRFLCHGETVYHLEISLGYQHRGIERAMINGSGPRGIHYMETLAGDTTIGHATTYSHVQEALAGVTTPARSEAIRAIAAELERIANHIGDLSTWTDGDCFARTYIRWLEVRSSIDFLRHQLRELPAGPLNSALPPPAAESLAVSLVEGWRGEICHVAATDDSGRFAFYRVVDPSFHNWFGLALALRGQQISDFPLCNKSFNLSYCGHDL